MQNNIAIQKARELSHTLKAAVEEFLGRKIAAEEEVSVMAFFPHEAPHGETRQTLAHSLDAHLHTMSDKAKDVPTEELDQLLDEAMQHVRPTYGRKHG